jgi:suppressor for copper-sensitivity B
MLHCTRGSSWRRAALGLAAAAAVLAGQPAVAAAPATSGWAGTEFAEVRLIAAADGLDAAGRVRLGLEFRLAEGWKVYWRAPGDAGYPPAIDWQGADNLKASTWSWPVPERFSVLGLETLGYEHGVVFPIDAQAADPSRPLALNGAMHALVCSDICVPLDADLSLTVAPDAAGPTAFTQLIDRYRALVPLDAASIGAGVGLGLGQVSAFGAPAPHSLSITVTASAPLGTPDVFIEGPAGFSFGKPAVTLAADRRAATMIVPAGVPKGGMLAGTPLTLTLVDGARFVESRATVGTAPPSGGIGVEPGLLAVLGLAFLGGLILNLMPCVLPVLSLKLIGVLKHGGGALGTIRRGFLASAAGIVVSFLALAAVAAGLKAAGLAVGWGIQFQQPVFLVAMTAVLLGFAANLWGWLEIPLPRTVADLAASLGGSRGDGDGLAGHFLTGALATLLATPCSAPFLGTAVGFALSRGTAEILVVFAAMGVGLAAPYLLVAAVPGLARALPRPGAWMVTLRRLLGLALAGTAVWLLSVIAVQTDVTTSVAVAAAFAAALAAIWLAAPERRTLSRRVAASVVVLLVLAAAGLGVRASFAVPDQTGRAATETAGEAVDWQPFDQARLDRLAADGAVVLVDVTADWCLTCKVNKALVLDAGPVRARLAGGGIVAMRADWTLPDPAISAYLASFRRYGIPFNAVYGPGARGGIALPELLTRDAVLEAIDRATGGS